MSVAAEANKDLVRVKGKALCKYFDHTLLKPDATIESVRAVVEEGLAHNFASICVNSCYVDFVASLIKESSLKVCAVVGFPLGAMATSVKVAEAIYCIDSGANEIDMVLNIGYLKSNLLDLVSKDIKAVVGVCHERNQTCKVIIETCLLTPDEISLATTLSIEAGADFVKTSTGFSTGGATSTDVARMASLAHPVNVQVKASGGIRDGAMAIELIESGADRLGTSATVKVYKECLNILSHNQPETNEFKGKNNIPNTPSSLY